MSLGIDRLCLNKLIPDLFIHGFSSFHAKLRSRQVIYMLNSL